MTGYEIGKTRTFRLDELMQDHEAMPVVVGEELWFLDRRGDVLLVRDRRGNTCGVIGKPYRSGWCRYGLVRGGPLPRSKDLRRNARSIADAVKAIAEEGDDD